KQEEQSVPVSGGTGQQTLVVNASEATISGVEIDFSWLATDYFALEGNLGLLDAEYDELEDPVLGVDLSHLELRRAPDVTATVAPVLTVPLGAGQLTARAALRYVDDMELTFLNSPQSSVDSHTVLDASITYSLNNLSISVWGLNLTEDDSWTQAYDVGSNPAFPGLWTYTAIRPPRTYGAVVSWHFGSMRAHRSRLQPAPVMSRSTRAVNASTACAKLSGSNIGARCRCPGSVSCSAFG